jgi:hypothetical protein
MDEFDERALSIASWVSDSADEKNFDALGKEIATALRATARDAKREVELERDALEAKLDNALIKLSQVLVHGRNPNEAAWWLATNHPRFVLNHGNLFRPEVMDRLMAMATQAGAPPSDTLTWQIWFDRVREVAAEHEIEIEEVETNAD